MQDIYNYIPETNHVYRAYSAAAVLYLQSVLLHVTSFSVLNILYLHNGTSQNIIIIIIPQQVSGIFNVLNLSRFRCLILPLL